MASSLRSIYAEFLPSRVRFYCDCQGCETHTGECGARNFPNDRMDARVEAPEPGRAGRPVLLRTWNHTHPEAPYAYCFSCRGMRPMRRLEPKEVLTLYLHRGGVVVRRP